MFILFTNFCYFRKKIYVPSLFIFSLFAKITIWCSCITYLFLILVSHLHLAFHFERRKVNLNSDVRCEWHDRAGLGQEFHVSWKIGFFQVGSTVQWVNMNFWVLSGRNQDLKCEKKIIFIWAKCKVNG